MDAIAVVGEAVLANDPLAEITLQLRCPTCGALWAELFDTVRLVVDDFVARGRQALLEVDLLARTYGWTEDDVLRLPAARRASYAALALS